MKIYLAIRRLFSLIVGTVFFLAGTLKLMDPVGAGLVVGDYFKFFSMEFLSGASKTVAVGMALFETALGAAIITGIWRRIMAWVTLGVTVAFTVLTLILYIKNPDMDCGCFGELVHLTHGQSLVKNLIMLALWAAACFPLRYMQTPKKVKYATFGLAVASSVAFLVFSLIHIPIVNLTPFKAGVKIGFDTRMDEVPLSLRDFDGNYQDFYFSDSSDVAVSLYDPDPSKVAEAFRSLEAASDNGFRCAVILSSPVGAPSDSLCLYADRRELMSLNRSNGGATFVSKGTIVRKWSSGRIPDRDGFAELSEADPLDEMLDYSATGRLALQAYLLYVFAVMLLL